MGKRGMQVHEITERPPKKAVIPRPEPAVELEEVEVDPAQPSRRVRIGVGLSEKLKGEITRVLQEHRLVFAWGPEDMPGVDRSVISHRLAVDPEHRPVVQKKRYLANDRREFVKKEVSTLLAAGHVREVKYPECRSLKAAETRYTALEKIVYALVVTVRKLAPYFQAHTVRVLTDQPLGSVLRNPSSSGRLVKWAVELTQYGIEYQPRPSIKGQALADFLVECTASEEEKESASESTSGEWWEMHADGASSRQHRGGGVVLITPEGFRLYYALRYLFPASNNEAEYEAVLNGLRLAKGLGIERLRVKTDSRLVVGQISGTCEAKNARMALYKECANKMLKGFEAYEIEYISRADNVEADILSKIAMEGVPDRLIKICQKEELSRPSVEEAPLDVQQVSIEGWNREKNPEMFWINDIRRFKETGELPADPSVAARVRRKAPSFRIVDGDLYKQSFGGPLLKCLLKPEAEKAFARKDTRPATFYTPVTTAIPFAKWGIDLLGPLPVAPGGLKFCVVAVDYFTKWVEAEPLATITEYQCRRFLWKKAMYELEDSEKSE
ncbi:PREDICTED: uncharacterized protein LOC109168884 [Ipomoea nil]|uniref:uncharacterized protein LOC109168884 n=1 Tax=Ipomoea nil TaxID=35883 RepID=UPI0009017D3C|nr:PREDICTED: uncharacterized protein LOC109168884 [Ipomoea nil]